MRVFAPGKLVLTGAYAVLRGAPAIVAATSRGAVADSSRPAASPTPEVRAALGGVPAPHVDATEMFDGDRKLGLGASAAILVASLGARASEEGVDLGLASSRDALFRRARAAHAEAQGGGSGVDVAASVYGGVLRYAVDDASPLSVHLPDGARLVVFTCDRSARTSDLLARVGVFASRDPVTHGACMDELVAIAVDAATTIDHGDLGGFVRAIQRASRALDRLGTACGTEIVPGSVRELAAAAEREGAALCVSGAGGGDVAVFVGPAAPSPTLLARARELGLTRLDLEIDDGGVRVLTSVATTSLPASSASREGITP